MNTSRQAAYYAANKEKVCAKQRERFARIRDVRNAEKREYHRQNKERLNVKTAQRYAANAAARQAQIVLRRAAKLKRAPAWLTEHDLLVMECRYAVALMLTRVNGEPWSVDHVIPYHGKLVSGLHVPNNLQWLPLEANMKKTNAFDPGGAV